MDISGNVIINDDTVSIEFTCQCENGEICRLFNYTININSKLRILIKIDLCVGGGIVNPYSNKDLEIEWSGFYTFSSKF